MGFRILGARALCALRSATANMVMAVLMSFAPGADPARATAPPPADITAREIIRTLFLARAGEPADFSGRALRYLDLSGLDFKGALFVNADLYGIDLTGAQLAGADLTGVRLDRANIAKADFSGADLTGATLLRPNAFLTVEFDIRDAPKFNGAKLIGVRVKARLDGADFRGADLTAADFSPLEKRPGERDAATNSRNQLIACNFSGATLSRVDFTLSILTHARFVGADLRGANFTGAELSNADFSGANLAGADFTGADLDGARIGSAIGLDEVIGLADALNVDTARR